MAPTYTIAPLAITVMLAVPHAGGSASASTTDQGRITGLVSSEAEARSIPCPSRDVVGEWGAWGAGVACFPKRAATWRIDQLGACTVRSDATTGFQPMGNCVRGIDLGTEVKVWTYRGAVDEAFAIVWG